MIEVTDTAIQKLIDKKVGFIRLGVKGGGCAGFEYSWDTYNEEEYGEHKTDHDTTYELDETHKLILDGHSEMMLIGSTIDFKSDFTGAMLVVENPNAQSSCGCGTSVNFA